MLASSSFIYAVDKYTVEGVIYGVNGNVQIKLVDGVKDYDDKTNKKGSFKLKRVLAGMYVLQVVRRNEVIHEQSINVDRDIDNLEIKVGSISSTTLSNSFTNTRSKTNPESRTGNVCLPKDPKQKFLELSKLYVFQNQKTKSKPKQKKDSYLINENDYDAPIASYGVIDRTISDKKGKFEFKWISKGKHKIIAYKPATKFYGEFLINIKSSDKIKLDIDLRENKYEKYKMAKLIEWEKYKMFYITKYLRRKNINFNNPISKEYYKSLFN